ncbi:MAG: hypothetical protein HON90_17485 [Halobacteriovoraceae bacterium]|jgi:hypothetical protein|nr:hypothetical protein [Halobacteriovoraceae bacterium]
MFYLKEFSKILRSNLLLGFIFVLSVTTMLSIAHNNQQFKKYFSLYSKSTSLPYFNALVTNKIQLDSIVRRMKKLPGVVSVSNSQGIDVQNEVNRLKKTFGAQIVDSISSSQYQKIKIQLDLGLREKSYLLIKEYLIRLTGKNDVTVGSIRTPKELSKNQNTFLQQFLTKIDIYAFVLAMSFWFMSSFLLLKPINKTSYIIDKFQRRTKTNVKVYLAGISVLALTVLGVNFLITMKVEFLSLGVFLGMVLFVVLITLKNQNNKLNYERL